MTNAVNKGPGDVWFNPAFEAEAASDKHEAALDEAKGEIIDALEQGIEPFVIYNQCKTRVYFEAVVERISAERLARIYAIAKNDPCEAGRMLAAAWAEGIYEAADWWKAERLEWKRGG